MKKLIGVVGGAAVFCAAMAFAADPNPSRGLDRALEQVEENIAKNPNAKGLPNAVIRLKENKIRQATRGKNHAPGQQKQATSRVEPKDTSNGAERTPPVDRVERVERLERPDRPEHPDRPDRPERPHR